MDRFLRGWISHAGPGSNGQLYSWGRNWEGQLGLGTGGGYVATPTAVLLPPGVTGGKTIAAGYKHSLAVGDDCSLYAWGKILRPTR